MEKPTWHIVHFIDAENMEMLDRVFARGHVENDVMVWVVPKWLEILRTIEPGGK
jgi:hypothetical protein